jgi:hypothetical protein
VGLGAANTFADMKAQQIAPDIIDTYLVAVTGFNSGGGNAWPQWQYNYPDGGVVTKFSDDVAAMGWRRHRHQRRTVHDRLLGPSQADVSEDRRDGSPHPGQPRA